MIGDSNKKTNFPHKLLLTNIQVSKIRKAFVNNSSANIKLSKTQKTGQPEIFLGRLLRPLLKPGLFLMKGVLKPLAKSVLIPLGLYQYRCRYTKESFWICHDNINNFKWMIS